MARLRGVLVGYQLLDLACPVDHDCLETRHQVSVQGGSLDIAEILIGDIEVLHALCNITGFSDDSHEVVEVGGELFLDVRGPLVLAEQLGAGVVHHCQQLVKGIAIAEAKDDACFDVLHRDLLRGVALDEVSDLVVLYRNLGRYKLLKVNKFEIKMAILALNRVFHVSLIKLNQLTGFIVIWRAFETPAELGVLEFDPHKELIVVCLLKEQMELREALLRRCGGLLGSVVIYDFFNVLEHPLNSYSFTIWLDSAVKTEKVAVMKKGMKLTWVADVCLVGVVAFLSCAVIFGLFAVHADNRGVTVHVHVHFAIHVGVHVSSDDAGGAVLVFGGGIVFFGAFAIHAFHVTRGGSIDDFFDRGVLLLRWLFLRGWGLYIDLLVFSVHNTTIDIIQIRLLMEILIII